MSFEAEGQLRRTPVLRRIVDVILSFPVKSCVCVCVCVCVYLSEHPGKLKRRYLHITLC